MKLGYLFSKNITYGRTFKKEKALVGQEPYPGTVKLREGALTALNEGHESCMNVIGNSPGDPGQAK